MIELKQTIQKVKKKSLLQIIHSIDWFAFRWVGKKSVILTFVYSLLCPIRPLVLALPTTSGWLVWEPTCSSKFYVPQKKYIYRGVSEWRERKRQRYTLDGFVEPEEGDTVVDAGAFRGEFTSAVSSIAGKIISIEPDPDNLWFLIKNVRSTNTCFSSVALWKTDSVMQFSLGEDSSDSSLVNVDSEEIRGEITVRTMRLDHLIESMGVSEVDFLKLDAEGGEPEVMIGSQDVNINKVAIDCSMERNDESTVERVREILSSQGFETRRKSMIVFGRIENSS